MTEATPANGELSAARRTPRSPRPTQVPAGFWQRPELDDVLTRRDVRELFRALQDVGMPQRTIARLTGQAQSEISEVLSGRQVRSVEVLERIAEGLGIPRDRMGLGRRTDSLDLPSEHMPAAADHAATLSTAPCRCADMAMPPKPWRSSWDGGGVARPLPTQVTAPVFRWTGAEVRMIRESLRMSVREFAARLGVSDRMVSKWEASGRNIQPRPVNQAALDTLLAQAPPEARARFVAWPTRTRNHAALVEARRWVLHVVLDVETLDEAQGLGMQVLSTIEGLPKLAAKEATVSPEDRPYHRYSVTPINRNAGDLRR